MAEETVRVESTEDLDSLVQRLKRSGSKDVVLAVPEDARALQTLDQFNVLRREVKDAGLSLTFMGGNKTTRGLAKILGFPTREGAVPGSNGNGGNAVLNGNEINGNGAIYGSDPTIPYPTPNTNGISRNGGNLGNPGLNGGGRAMPFGVPDGGFVVAPDANQPPQMPPPSLPNYQDLVNDVQNFNPSFATSRIQPPPTSNNLNGNGDVRVTRDNAGDFFGDNSTSSSNGSRNRPEYEFNFAGEGGASGPGPMSIEEARRRGLLGENIDGLATENLPGDDFFADQAGPAGNEDGLNIPYDDGTAAANFRSGVRNRNATAVDADGVASNRAGRRNGPRLRRTGGAAAIALPAALSGLGGRVRRIINPVQPVAANTPRMTSDLDPVTRRRRQMTGRNYNRIALLALLAICLLVLIVIVLNITGGNSNTNNNNQAVTDTTPGSTVSGTDTGSTAGGSTNGAGGALAKLTLTMKSQQVQAKQVQLIFTPISGNAGPSLPANQSNGNVGAMNVKSVDSGQIEVKGSHPAFGTKIVNIPARGTATITNRGSVGTGYSAGTILFKANGINYRTVTSVSVPAGNLISGAVGRASVEVVADDNTGDKGNLPQGWTAVLSNASFLQTGPIGGGVNQQVRVVSAQDQSELQNQLTQQAQSQSASKFDGQYDKTSQGLVTLPSGQPSCVFTLQVGQEAPNGFEGDCKMSAKGYIYNKSDLVQAVQQEVGTPGQNIDASSITPDYSQGKLQNKDGRDFYTVPVSYSVFATPNLDDLKKAIANQPIKDVPTIIANQFGNDVDGINFNGYKGDKLPAASQIEITPANSAAATTTSPSGTVTDTATNGVGTATPTSK